MPIVSGDLKFLASQVMDDVPEGGGAPTSTVIPDGGNNDLFPDVTEVARSRGRTQIRQISVAAQSTDRATYMDANVIVSEPPNDPNISVTIMKAPGVFARRTAVEASIESYLVAASKWGGYLLENHVINQRSIQLLQRPGSALPATGRTLVLIANEGLPNEVSQKVRTTKVERQTRVFTELIGNSLVDFEADVVTCDIDAKLLYSFPGSPPTRTFTAAAGKTVLRDTTVADAGLYCGVSPLQVAGVFGSTTVQAKSIFTQLVPNSRTEQSALDQRPADVRTMVLATAPRRVEVSAAPHTRRIKIGQENQRFVYVDLLAPLPAPGSVVISYRSQGNWYTAADDGLGSFTGSAAGQIIYTTGSLAITLQAMPDAGSELIIQFGEVVGFTSRAGGASFRRPEFEFALEHDQVKPGSVVVTWLSGGVLKTATDSGTGTFTGDATGAILYGPGRIRIRPVAMIDAGGEFNIDFEWADALIETFTGLSPDASGFVNMTLAQVPTPGTITVLWLTTRTTSATAGSNAGTALQKDPSLNAAIGAYTPEVTTTTVTAPAAAATPAGNTSYNWLAGQFPANQALRSD